jgi:hypothetical protein
VRRQLDFICNDGNVSGRLLDCFDIADMRNVLGFGKQILLLWLNRYWDEATLTTQKNKPFDAAVMRQLAACRRLVARHNWQAAECLVATRAAHRAAD